ncbi:hypothetical protein DITRI_Ditri09bG0119500 [Diplodiscus trichospermus]
MDDGLRRAAWEGKVCELYRLIQRDENVLRRIDQVEFIDTPLHIAADAGCIDFAMEIMSLKPTFSRVLNQEGLSPIHIAAKKRHKEIALRLLQIDKDLVRVRGKKSKTPLHYISNEGNCEELLERFLEACPESIRDMTAKNGTALHIAAKANRLDVFQVLIRVLRKTDYCQEVVNQKDQDGNTALHIAATKNQPKMIKLLLKCKADKHATNQAGSTALDIAEQHNNRESINTLRGCFIPRVSTFIYRLQKQIVKYVTKASSVFFHDMDNISSEDRNALLVIFGLLLTATFQASLSPPGSVWQGDGSSRNSTVKTRYEEEVIGKTVMDQIDFLAFYIPTSAVFVVTFFLTLGLLKPFPRGFRTALQVLLAFLAICFYQSIFFLAPTDLAGQVINLFSVLVFILMIFMCLAYRVSKVSVLVLGCWLFPTCDLFVGNLGYIILGCWLFLSLYDEFWKGTALAFLIGFGGRDITLGPATVLGCWFLLSLCRFCIMRCNKRCNA